MKISNANISQEKINKLEDNSPSDVMTIWEKIKDWFGFSQEKKVLTLIHNIYFSQETTVLEKNRDFFHLKKLAGEQYRNNFQYKLNNNNIDYCIDFNGEIIKSSSDVTPLVNAIKNELNLDLKNYSSEELGEFINNSYKLSTLSNDDNDFGEKFSAFREILTEFLNDEESSLDNQRFDSNAFDAKESFNDKYDYLKENSKKYLVNIDAEQLVKNIYDSTESHSYEKLREQVKNDILRYDLKFNGEKISDIVLLENKLKPLNNQDTMIIFELLNQGIFPIIKNSFEEYEHIASMYSPFTGKTSVNIEKKDNSYIITVNNKKEITDCDIKKVSQLSDSILNEFDHNSMNLYIKNFVDSPITREKVDIALAKYQNEIMNKMSDKIGDKFNYKQNRFLLLEESINIKFEFNPDLMKKLTILPNESKVEYSLLKS
ncbi:hypothetical protein GY03_08870 [Proteus vulgaris]|uniref:hypothetical protein n=1 Tax=Proteus vulgaris TaxID=585 RepID=UPI0021B1534D|nr:hypothetical protein [Proteus vulgaris]MCT6517378.1 hypothetical protein [Proteus vulgaris]